MAMPWDPYAEQLFPLGYGYPLRIPESYFREVAIGDVGWLKEGEFRPLFNSMKDTTDVVNEEKGFPPHHDPFSPPDVSIVSCDKIMDIFYYSQPLARSRGIDIESKHSIVNYMRDHFDEWIERANSCYIVEPKEQDIVFISSIIKPTPQTGVTFHGSMNRKEALVQGDIGSFSSSGTVNIFKQTLPAKHNRLDLAPSMWGPLQPSLTYPNYATPTPSRPAANQCLFVHFYKMKRRFWLRNDPMKTTAGSHPLPPESGQDNPGIDEPMIAAGLLPYEFEFEDMPGCGEPYDPVNILLDYILSKSEAEYATASDLDLIAIFTGGELPIQRDLTAVLQRLSPVIEVDERSVATISISVDFQIQRKRKHEDAEEAETKRPRSEDTPYEHDAIVGPSGHHGHFDYHITGQIPAQYDVPYSQEGMLHAEEYMAMPPEHTVCPPEGVPYTLQGVQYAGSELYPPKGMPYPPQDMLYLSQHVPPPVYDFQADTSFPPRTVPPVPPYTPAKVPPDTGNLRNDEDNNKGNHDDDSDGPGPSKRLVMDGITHHEGSVTALVYSANKQYAASGSEDTSIIIWDVFHQTPIRKVEGEMADTVSSLAFSPDNHLLACAAHSAEIVFLSVESGRVVRRTDVGQSVHSIAYTPIADYLIGCSVDGTLHAWDTVDYVEHIVLTRYAGLVTFITFSPDGHLMATGGGEDVCYVWETVNLASGAPLSMLAGHKGLVCAAAFAPDNLRIVTASDDGSSRIWNAETGDALVILHEHASPVWAVAFSPNGGQVASGSSSTVNMISAIDFSPDGRYIAVVADNGVRLWNADNGSCFRTYNEHDGNVTMAKFSSDSSSLMSGSHDGTVSITPLPVNAP